MDRASRHPVVGQRLAHQGYKGTIRFIGEVEGSQGSWLGVEWDDPIRGKHSGSKDGIEYFHCSISGSGSFIRLTKAVDLGQTFLEALKSKYIDASYSGGEKETIILGSSNGTIEVEAVGLQRIRAKLSCLGRLREVSLDSENVAFPDPPEEIRLCCPNVRALDLSHSLLSSWVSMSLIASELPALRDLTLDHNRFACLHDAQPLTGCFSKLEELRLNQTLIKWAEVLKLLPAMPSLRLLEVARNQFEELGGTGEADYPVHSCIEILNFDENRLRDWEDIMIAVTKLPSLKRVVLTSNNITSISPPPQGRSFRIDVEHVGMQVNSISAWSDIDALGLWLPQLRSLSLVGNPICCAIHDFRPQVISRLPSLEVLDGSPISTKERNDSELFFLSQIARDLSIPSDERSLRYPRWSELCKKHGTPESNQPQNNRATIAGRLIDVTAYYGEAARLICTNDHEVSARQVMAGLPLPVIVPVLPSMNMRAFRLKLLKALKVPTDVARHGKLDVFLLMDNDRLTRLDMSQESRDLAWWGIQSGSTIVVINIARKPHQL